MYLLMFISGKFQGLRGFQVYKYWHSIIFARSMGGGVVGGGRVKIVYPKNTYLKNVKSKYMHFLKVLHSTYSTLLSGSQMLTVSYTISCTISLLRVRSNFACLSVIMSIVNTETETQININSPTHCRPLRAQLENTKTQLKLTISKH